MLRDYHSILGVRMNLESISSKPFAPYLQSHHLMMGEVETMAQVSNLVNGKASTRASGSNTELFPGCLSTCLGSSCPSERKPPKNEFLVISGPTEVYIRILPSGFLVGPAEGLRRAIPFREVLDLRLP